MSFHHYISIAWTCDLLYPMAYVNWTTMKFWAKALLESIGLSRSFDFPSPLIGAKQRKRGCYFKSTIWNIYVCVPKYITIAYSVSLVLFIYLIIPVLNTVLDNQWGGSYLGKIFFFYSQYSLVGSSSLSMVVVSWYFTYPC